MTERSKKLTLAACILGSGVVFLDGTVVNVALPAIQDDLNASLAAQQWVVEAYLLTLGSLVLIGGSLDDLFERRRIFAVGAAVFGVCSALCALSPSVEFLIAMRALQGAGGALLVPSTLAIIIATFPESERGAAIGSWTAWTGVATVVGPLAGGVLIETVSWRLIFLINIPLIAITLGLIPHIARSTTHPENARIDFLGAALCALGLCGVVLALIQQPRLGWGSAEVAVSGVGGLALLVLFVLHERVAPSPMLPLSLFGVRNFAVGNTTTLTMYAGLGAGIFFINLFLQQVAGYTPVQAGASLLPVTLIMFALSRRVGQVADRHGPRLFMGLGPLVAAVGLLLLLRVDVHADYATTVGPALVVFGLGLALTVAPLTATVLGAVETRHAGVASGVNNAIARVAGLIAIAALGAFIASRYVSSVDAHLTGLSLSHAAHAAVETARSRPLTTGSAHGLTGHARALLTHVFQQASLSAFRLGIALTAGLVALGGVVSLVGIVSPRRTVAAAECSGGALYGAQPEAVSAKSA